MATTYTKVFEELTSHLNFTMNIVSQKLEYGMRNRQTLIWSGVMGEIVYNRADFAVADMALTSFRICFVDFTLPLIISKINLYFKEPGICGIKWIGYFQTFSSRTWVTIIILITTTPLLLFFMKICRDQSRSIVDLISENFICIWGIFCQQALIEFPKSSSLRVAYFTIILTAVLIMAHYSAALICFLTACTHVLPFQTLDEFIDDGTYKLIVIRNSADYDIVTPITIVILPDFEAYLEFVDAVKVYSMSFPVWFILFLYTPDNNIHDYCHEPIGNPFNLAFDTQMLVLCNNEIILREWYSIKGETVKIFDLAEWKDDEGFVPLTNLSLYERRKNMEGVVLRAVAIKFQAQYEINPFYIKLMKLMKDESELPRTPIEGFMQVCNERNVAFMVMSAQKKSIEKEIPCKLSSITTERITNLVIMLSKNNPYTGVINYHLQKFLNNGMIMRLRETYSSQLAENKIFKPVYLFNVIPILAILCGGFIISIIMLIIENIHYRSRRRQSKVLYPSRKLFI
ncbi:PREDICTED: uncharacterized protein LOC105626591 [Atta cephalotes]|uniref:Ionotropic glutamate receptor C-terminal domain-containing protein n=1 Tax=Atta cephalotes TaxID=12957 RepID=A0A158P0G7_ATTCE|nr:PREDICTED: uncharacterized protein LOC105626591 [Atta cephalotes]